MNQLAILAPTHYVRILAFEVMSNHIHFILCGNREDCLAFFAALKRKLKRYFSGKGRYVRLTDFDANVIPIDNLNSLRKEIAYVHRNGFLVYPGVTPFSYPWGSGILYFNQIPRPELFPKYSTLSEMQKRAVCRGRAAELPVQYRVDGDLILPQTYCDYELGMSLFRDAQHYFSILSKNYEAYSEIAKRLGDSIFLTDDEMFAALRIISKKQFDESRPSMLPNASKLELARIMRKDYNASEGQIQRMLRLDPGVVRELFGKN